MIETLLRIGNSARALNNLQLKCFLLVSKRNINPYLCIYIYMYVCVCKCRQMYNIQKKKQKFNNIHRHFFHLNTHLIYVSIYLNLTLTWQKTSERESLACMRIYTTYRNRLHVYIYNIYKKLKSESKNTINIMQNCKIER